MHSGAIGEVKAVCGEDLEDRPAYAWHMHPSIRVPHAHCNRDTARVLAMPQR